MKPIDTPRALQVIVTLIVGLGTVACGGPEDGPEAASGAVTMPEIDAEQAGEVISDAMLVASRGLYLAIAGPPDAGSVASRDGRLLLEWSDDADFRTGAGTYEITLDEYRIPDDDAFASHYYGYILSGTILLASGTGDQTSIEFGIDARHDEPESYPARRVEVRLSGVGEEDDPEADGTVRVNGRAFSFDELAPSF
ncbi:MAG: hypothetical protein ACOCW3_04970 [Spirochaetota bacterium]